MASHKNLDTFSFTCVEYTFESFLLSTLLREVNPMTEWKTNFDDIWRSNGVVLT